MKNVNNKTTPTKGELREYYINSKTKNWDVETLTEYLNYVEEDFVVWYQGYEYAMEEMKKLL